MLFGKKEEGLKSIRCLSRDKEKENRGEKERGEGDTVHGCLILPTEMNFWSADS